MSRACRKVLKQKQPTLAESEDIETEDLVPEAFARNTKNTFQMAAQLLSSSSSDEEADNKSASEEEDEETDNIKTQKKKNRKRNRQNHVQRQDREQGDSCGRSYPEEDEVDRSLREINQMLGEVVLPKEEASSLVPKLDMRVLLNVHNRLLDPQTEITQKKKKPPPKHSKCFNAHLVTPKLEWGFYGRPVGLVMKQVMNKNGMLVFAYEHNATYENIHFEFLDIVHSPYVTELNGFLHQYPFHVDTLLLCALLNRWSNDRDMELELLSRALYSLESALHPSFSFSRGDCVLPYRYQCNRPFHCALLQQVCLSVDRGAPHTALELCKLGLSLDRGDPLGLVLIIDSVAFACNEASWLLSFLHSDYSLVFSFLPNIAYSMALAHHILGHETDAESTLQRAVRHFPWLLKYALEAMTPPSLASNAYLTAVECPEPLHHLGNIYGRRCGSHWRNPKVVEWVTKCLPPEALPAPDNDSPASETRKRFLTTLPLPIKRHLILARDSQANESLTMEELLRISWNPYPPPGGIESYQPRVRPVVPALPVPSDMNPLLAFLHSLSPSFNTSPANNS